MSRARPIIFVCHSVGGLLSSRHEALMFLVGGKRLASLISLGVNQASLGRDDCGQIRDSIKGILISQQATSRFDLRPLAKTSEQY